MGRGDGEEKKGRSLGLISHLLPSNALFRVTLLPISKWGKVEKLRGHTEREEKSQFKKKCEHAYSFFWLKRAKKNK